MSNIHPKLDYGQFAQVLKAVDTHTEGEFTRVVYDGFPEPQGRTMLEKKQWFAANCDHLRRALMHEPRGHHDTMGAILCQPVHEECSYGVIFIDTGGFLNMCGHGTIGVATVLINCGLIPNITEPYTEVVLDMPAGVIRVRAEVKNGKAVSVSLVNVPAFLYKSGQKVTVEGRDISCDIAFGGSFFALVDAQKQLGIDHLGADNVEELIGLGLKIRAEINRTVPVHHPQLDIDRVDLVEFYVPSPHPERAHMRNVVIFGDGQADRSPCGTGTTAKLAALYAHGKVGLHEKFVHESFIDTLFTGEVLKETRVGDFPAVVVRITGHANITGVADYLIDPDDPLGYGFLIEK